ncbi:type I restriction-modification system subunit S [Alcanivorax hongdengensis A-11-3]|uniref:Type I restriction-modification system subunit S n=1 Tax=Alcanivorax hongdengensis A-11-3 TaxID=1177179 RepID=L0W987_9GAMM|nr:restriction endonuclease subunit S [Alcanivorax hongdengensis]EKF73544.1 type I restriction-modification system subunit S [Alcanivorax hongdengensis A-11-3]
MSNTVPEGWASGIFGDLAKVQNGFAFKSSDFSDSGFAAVIRMSNLKAGKIDLEDAKFVSADSLEGLDKFKLTPGDFLFGMSGSLDNYAWVREQDGCCYLNQRVGCLRAKGDSDPLFTSYCYLSEPVKMEIIGLAAGAAQLNISSSQLESISVDIPPLHEQQKIAAILSSVDDVIEKTRAQIDKLKDLKTGMMQELLTKGIGHTAFKDSPVGRIPDSWDVKALGELTSLIKSGLSRRISSQDIGIPLLISGNIKHGSLDTTELRYWYVDDPQGANTSNYMLNDGDILMCFINSMSQIGKSCIFRDIGRPAIYTTNLFRIVPKKDYSSEYLQMIFMTSRFQNEIQLISKPAVNQASFTKSDLEQLYVPVPPTTERDLITKAVTSIGDKILATEHRLMGLFGIKKSLMQDLLTGKVRVNVDNNNLEARVAG